jgi:hypothetical protein
VVNEDASNVGRHPIQLQPITALAQEAVEAQGRDSAAARRLAEALGSVKTDPVDQLMLRLQTSEQPLVVWALHVELDNHDIPPCVRPRAPVVSPQSLFIEMLADLHWLARRHPDHAVLRQQMRGVFQYDLRSERWHKTALWVYRQCRGMRYLVAKGLALDDAQRLETATLYTKQQLGDRRALANRMAAMREAWLDHALRHPDKAGIHSAETICRRRALFVRVHVLLGRRTGVTAQILAKAYGQTISRQALARNLHSSAVIADEERFILSSP